MSSQLVLHKASEKGININISVETELKMHDYQIDGVRFLFKQWKLWKDHSHNKPSGYCVLNFPPQSGKSVTVVVFLYALRKLIPQPILVLCKDDKQVKYWTKHFEQWSGFTSDDIVVEPTKALLNKQIFIKKMCNLGPFTRRSWSFLILKDEECSSLPHFPHVEFTIWMTSTDLSKDVRLLKNVHSWILPKTEFMMEMHCETNWKNRLLKHSMLENIVLRKTNNSISFSKILLKNQNGEDTFNSIKNKPKRSKNKDATGLKIKRSKVNTIDVISRKIRINNDDKDECNDLKMDVEAFIRNEKPVTFDELDDFDVINGNIEDTNHKVDEINDNIENTNHKVDEINDNIEDTNHKVDEINDNIEDTNHKVDEINDGDTRNICVSKEVNCDLIKTWVNDDFSTQIASNNIKFEPIVESCDENDKENCVTTSGETLSKDLDFSVKNNEEHTILKVTKSADNKEINIKIENETSGFKNMTEYNRTTVDVNNQDNVPIENNMTSDKSENVANDDQKQYIIADIKKEEKFSLKNESDLDSKLNEMQEKAMKKFKGSFLDSIF